MHEAMDRWMIVHTHDKSKQYKLLLTQR